jgi:ABC-type dipeptide/oligopeptide/nickel transport system ATPase component
MSEPLLRVEGLHVTIRTKRQDFDAVRGLAFAISKGEIAGLIGESGSGKSMTAAAILNLLPPQVTSTGTLLFEGNDLRRSLLSGEIRLGRDIGFVPQEPMTALNPTLRIEHQLTMPMRYHLKLSKADAVRRAGVMLERMQIADPARILAAFPFELSGGLRQRVLLANAFLMNPKLIVADEPTTALDVTVQAEVLALLKDNARASETAVLFITHNMGVVWNLCDTVQVMRAGCIVEHGRARDVLSHPQNAYTQALRASLPEMAPYRQPIGAGA